MKVVSLPRAVILHESSKERVTDWRRPHLWLTDIDREPEDPPPLARKEWERAKSLANVQERRQFVAQCAFLRRVLAPIVGAEAESLEFAAGLHGMPRLASVHDSPGDPSVHPEFNLSNSENILAVAVVFGGEVGIDIEVVRSELDASGVAEALLPPEVRHRLRSLPPTESAAAFCRHWTRQEAMAKSMGRGIAVGPPPSTSPGPGWNLESFELTCGGRDVVGALAWSESAGPAA